MQVLQPKEVINTLTAAGLALSLTADNNLKITPAKALTDDLRKVVKLNKQALVKYLKQAPANDGPAVDTTTTDDKRETYEERAAIMEHMGGIEKSEAERLAALQTWPNTQAMNPGEVDTFTARLARFTDKGVSYDDAERLADALVIRDRQGDDRRLCLECTHLQGTGRWRCGNWKQAEMARDGLARDLVLMLQRCGGFAARRESIEG